MRIETELSLKLSEKIDLNCSKTALKSINRF